jgi:hypothetical protein
MSHYSVASAILLAMCLVYAAHAIRMAPKSRFSKRTNEGNPCTQPDAPFPCKNSDKCIPIPYLCDDNQDCDDGYDEDPAVCTAAKRPPVDDMEQFLQNEQSWIMASLFAGRSVEQVARALAVSQTVEDYRKTEGLSADDIKPLCSALGAIQAGREDVLEGLGMPSRSWNTVFFFFSKLTKSGFIC